MSLFAFLLIMYLLTKKDKRRSDIFKGIFSVGIAIAILGSVFNFSSIPGVFIFVALLFWLGNRNKKAENEQEKESERYRQWRESAYSQNKQGSYNQNQTWDQARNQTQNTTGSSTAKNQRTSAKVTSVILPRAAKKRIRIVENFNKKFELNLTEEEMKRIVDASYLSDAWKKEVEAMTVDYATESEWFNGVTGWLRVYLYVFHIQNVSSDFPRQLQICDETFDEVMRYAESLQYATLDERIHKVNQRFFTRFDETTFMIAYRFMEKRGRKYDLDKIQVLKNEADYEEAARKYDAMEDGWQGDAQAGQARSR